MTRRGNALIDALKEEHRAILNRLDEIRNAGVDTPAGRQALAAFRPILFSHLDAEDEELYPPLRQAAQSDHALSERLDAFVGGMEAITGLARDLLSSFRGDDAAAPPTLADSLDQVAVFERFFAVLRHRIREEETVLYQEYLRVAEQRRG